MNRFKMAAFLLAIGASEAGAQREDSNVEMIVLCNLVEKKTEMNSLLTPDTPVPFTYEYEAALWKMAGAVIRPTDPEDHRPFDTRAEASIKIQRMWNERHRELLCEIEGYGRASVLKLGAENHFTKMLKDAITRYGMDPNKVDPTDGCTLLDYTERELLDAQTAGKGPVFIRELEIIRLYLIGAGAKHVHEVTGYSHFPKTNPCFANAK